MSYIMMLVYVVTTIDALIIRLSYVLSTWETQMKLSEMFWSDLAFDLKTVRFLEYA